MFPYKAGMVLPFEKSIKIPDLYIVAVLNNKKEGDGLRFRFKLSNGN
jgi:hypothetical protein